MKKILIGLCLFSSFAFAVPQGSDWEVFYSSLDEEAIYFMPSSLDVDRLGNKLLWFRMVDPKSTDDSYIQDMLFVIDCENNKIGGSHVIMYDKNGRKTSDVMVASFVAPLHQLDNENTLEKLSFKLMCSVS